MSLYLIFALGLFQVSLSQDVPLECRTKPRTGLGWCCANMPHYISLQLLKECDYDDSQMKCADINCAMKKNNILTVDNKLNKSAIKTYVLEQSSPEWENALDVTLQNCDFQDLPTKCAEINFDRCFLLYMHMNCPKSAWTNKVGCAEEKIFFEKCLPYIKEKL